MLFLKRHSFPLFVIILLAFSLHLFFLNNAIPFIYSGGDPFDQYVKFQRLLYDNYRDWNFEWSWLHGLGGDLIGQFSYYYATSPFFLVKLLFPIEESFADLANISLAISLVKAILAGTFFYFYMISRNNAPTAALFGTLIYIGSIKFMQMSFFAEFMADAFVFLPLVVWGLDRLLQDGKKGLFIVSVFLMTQSNFYFAYITTIYIGIHTIIYIIAFNKEHLPFKKFMSVVFTYFIGLLLAAYSFFPAVYQFFQAYRFSKEYPIPYLFPPDFYLNMPVGLFFNITMVTFPAITVLLLFGAFQFRKSIPKVPLWTALIFFIFYQIPFMYSVFNGFSAMESRWTYLFIFAIAVLSTYVVELWLKGKQVHISIFFLYIVFMIYAITREHGVADLLEYEWANWIIIIHFALPILFFVHKKIRTKVSIVILMLMFGLITIQQCIFFETQLKEPLVYKDRISKVIASYDEDTESHEVIQLLEKNAPQFSRTIFYRPYSRQVANFTKHNNHMLYGVPSLSSYHSLLDKRTGHFIFEQFQVKQFDSFSHFYNVDQRLFLQTYLQANTMIVDKNFKYVPDGYSHVETIGNSQIYQLDSPFPFAYVEDNVFHANDYDKHSIGEREMFLLQAYVSEHRPTNITISTVDLPSTLYYEELPFQQSEAFNSNENVLIIDEETSFTISLIKIPDERSQLLASFSIEEINGDAFTLKIENTSMKKRENSNRYSLPINNFTMNIDETIQSNELTFTLSKGAYRLSNLLFEMLPYDRLSAYQGEAVSNSFDLAGMNKNKVTLTGRAEKDGMLVTSIPYSKGWRVIVDGEKARTELINGAFLGIPITKGVQRVDLTYHSPFLRIGFLISILTLVAYTIRILYHRWQDNQLFEDKNKDARNF